LVRKRPYTPEEIDALLGREVGTTRQRGTWQRGKLSRDLILHLPIAELVGVGSLVKTARAVLLWVILRLQSDLMPKQPWQKPRSGWIEEAGMDRRAVARAGDELEAAGLVRSKREAGRATQYQLLTHKKRKSKANGKDRDPT
jgi:hypothetical protein